MAEIAFEYLLAKIEATRGSAESAPTRYLNMAGTLTPRKNRYRPDESRGTLAEYYQSVDTQKWADLEASGGLDVYTLPLILNTIVAGGIDGSGATAAALTTDLTGDNNDIVFTAVTGGGVGNTISIEYIDPAAATQSLEVDVDGRAIKVYLATDGSKVITTTGDLLKAEIAAHPVASTLVTCADKAGNDGSGVVTAMGATHLSGGTGVDVTTPGGGTNSRLWTFAPTMTADDLDAMTLWFGDPNVQVFRSGYCMLDELTIEADASGTDGVTLGISGQGAFPSKVADPVVPDMLDAPLLSPGKTQVWMDTSTIGSTALATRVVSAGITVPSGIQRKWLAAGPTSDLSFTSIGRGKRHAELRLTLEVPDTTEYDYWVAGTVVKTRVRFNGSLIEGSLYYYVDFDIYGPIDGLEWGENAGSNRTLELTILSEYDATAGYDWCFRIQNDRDAL